VIASAKVVFSFKPARL